MPIYSGRMKDRHNQDGYDVEIRWDPKTQDVVFATVLDPKDFDGDASAVLYGKNTVPTVLASKDGKYRLTFQNSREFFPHFDEVENASGVWRGPGAYVCTEILEFIEEEEDAVES